MNDSELLRRYLDDRADDALAELVRRHTDLIYSAALRQVGGDSHLAEDVVQQVFADLVRKAAALRDRASLSGWCYTSAHYAAAKLVRSERRRKARHAEALLMPANDPTPETDWNALRPVLDHAMLQLAERDRETVLLCYFERLPLAEIGRRLGLSENAASKVVERALDRLRASLARRGITSTAGALGAVLAREAVVAAPAGLASTITTALPPLVVASAAMTSALIMKKFAFVAVVALLLLMSGLATYKTFKVRALEAHISQLRMDNLPVVARRAKPAVATASTATPSTATASPAASGDSVASSVEPIRNAGRATPEAAYVTFYWALENGDVKLLAEDVAHDEDARAIFQKVFDELPAEARAFYGTPEIMAAAVGCHMNTIKGVQIEILGTKAHGADAVMLSYRRGGEPQVRSIPLVRADDGWKVVGRGVVYMDRSRAQAFTSSAVELASNPATATRVTMPARPTAP